MHDRAQAIRCWFCCWFFWFALWFAFGRSLVVTGSGRRLTVIALTVIAAGGLAGCSAATAGTPGSAGEVTDVTVDAVPATGAAGLYIAEDDGFFAAAGLKVTIRSSVSAADTVPDLLRGQADVTLGQWTTAIALEAAGKKLTALAAGNSGGPGLEEIVTIPGSPIRTLAQLAGKTIAVNATSGLGQLLVETAAAPYLPAARLRFTIVPFPRMGAALAAHRADAAFMIEPYLSQALMKYGVTELADIDQGPVQDIPITGYYATARWVHARPAVAAAFTRALEKGQRIAATDRAAVEQALISHLRISPETAAVMSLGTFPTGPVDPVELTRVGDLMRTGGVLPANADIPVIARKLVS
ncbi:MAG: ABC transporter substrate-binding protein [Trebonia sp.]